MRKTTPKYFTIFLILHFVLIGAKAQIIIKGNISDIQTNQPIEGVSIRLLPFIYN